jgi:hypothetical protein
LRGRIQFGCPCGYKTGNAIIPRRYGNGYCLGTIAAQCRVKGVTTDCYAVVCGGDVIPTVGKRTADWRQKNFAVIAKCSHITKTVVVEINGEIIAGCIGSGVAAFDIHKVLGTKNLLR